MSGVKSKGLKYDIKNIEFSPSNRIGTSNEVTGTKVLIELDGPGMIIILPQKCFKAVILKFDEKFLRLLPECSFLDVGHKIASLFLSDDIESSRLKNLVEKSIDFDAPLVSLNDKIHILDVFIEQENKDINQIKEIDLRWDKEAIVIWKE